MGKGILGREDCKHKGIESPNSMGFGEKCKKLGFLELGMFGKCGGRWEWESRQIMKAVYIYIMVNMGAVIQVMGSGEECLE